MLRIRIHKISEESPSTAEDRECFFEFGTALPIFNKMLWRDFLI